MGLGLQPLSTSQNTQISIAGSVQREAKTTGRKLKILTFKWPEIWGSLQPLTLQNSYSCTTSQKLTLALTFTHF